MKQITKVRKSVCAMANQLRKAGYSLKEAFKKAWQRVKLSMTIRAAGTTFESRQERIEFLQPFKAFDGRIKGDRIGIRQSLESIDEYNYNLAHELAHAYPHYDKGSILPDMDDKKLHKQYEEQADRAAKMLLAALTVG